MCRVAVSRKADDFTVNGRAARFGVLQFFKNQRYLRLHQSPSPSRFSSNGEGVVSAHHCAGWWRKVYQIPLLLKGITLRHHQQPSPFDNRGEWLPTHNRSPWLPEVQALEVGITRPRRPKNRPVLTAVVRHHLYIGGAGDVIGVLFRQHGGKFAHRTGTAGR